MPDGFVDLLDRADAFFADLARNNRKDWYEPRKDFYRDEIRKPAELLADLVAEDLARLTGRPHAPKVFRIHRDVRFSRDKTPYNAHLHLLWARPGETSAPAWFFGSAPDYTIVGMGAPTFEKDALERWRAAVDTGGDLIAAALVDVGAHADATVSDWGAAPLKRVPKPYGADHPHGDLLRRRGLTVVCPLSGDWRARGLVGAIAARARELLPLWHRLDEILA